MDAFLLSFSFCTLYSIKDVAIVRCFALYAGAFLLLENSDATAVLDVALHHQMDSLKAVMQLQTSLSKALVATRFQPKP